MRAVQGFFPFELLMRARNGLSKVFLRMGQTRAGMTRRAVLGASALLLPVPGFAVDENYDSAGRKLLAMERQLGLHINLAALDTGNGNSIFFRESERVLM